MDARVEHFENTASDRRLGAHRQPGSTSFKDCTDEYLAQLLGGISIHLQNPTNRELIREAQLRLVMRGADDRGGERLTTPTLEGLEERLEQAERNIKQLTGINFPDARDANQGR